MIGFLSIVSAAGLGIIASTCLGHLSRKQRRRRRALLVATSIFMVGFGLMLSSLISDKISMMGFLAITAIPALISGGVFWLRDLLWDPWVPGT